MQTATHGCDCLPSLHSYGWVLQHHFCKKHDYCQSNQYTKKNRHNGCHHDDHCNNHPRRDKKDFKKKPFKIRDDCKCNQFKKKEAVMHNDHSSSSSGDTLSRKRHCSWSKSPSCSCSYSCSCLRRSKRSYANHHVATDDHKQSGCLKRKYLYSKDEVNEGNGVHCPEKGDSTFATFTAPKRKKKKCGPI